MAGSRKSRSRKRSKSRKRSASKSKKKVLPPPPKGELGQYGYSSKDSVEVRRDTLRKAIDDLGVKKTTRILNLLRNYNKNNADVNDRMTADIEWLKGQKD